MTRLLLDLTSQLWERGHPWSSECPRQDSNLRHTV